MASYTLHIQYVDRPAETRTFTQAKVTFGRDAGDVVLHDTQVSGRHGEINFDGTTLRYTDMGSTNGSFLLQGQRVANIELTPGIALRLGNSLITVQVIDVPNVAGKGRTVIASPGMAPGFPAPMRPPGSPAVGASAPIPRPGMPAPPPGGFAFAPTAQMQSPVMPAGMPAGPQAGAFVPQPAPMASHPMAAPMAPPQPAPMPAPMAPPQPAFGGPPGPPPGTLSGVPQAPVTAPAPMPAPMAAPPGAMSAAPIAPLAAPQAPSAEGGKPDLVNDVKTALAGGWSVLAPSSVLVVGMFAAVMIPISVLAWVFVMLLPLGIAGPIAGLLALAQALAMIILVPAAYRYLLGAHLDQPITPKAAIEEVRAKIGDVFVNMLVPGIVLGVFAGPIYWVEGKKLGEVISRNFQLLGRDVVTVIVSWLALVIPITIVNQIVSWLFVKILGTFGLLLASVITNSLTAVMIAYGLGLSTWFYFNIRRRSEGGDPEGDARVRLAASLPAA